MQTENTPNQPMSTRRKVLTGLAALLILAALGAALHLAVNNLNVLEVIKKMHGG